MRANLVLAGVTKAGTTSLFSYLGQHLDIFTPRVKEIDYFTPLMYGRTLPPLAEYDAHFAGADTQRYRLDASPSYLLGGDVVARAVDDATDDARVLVSLRDPVARLWSSYRFKQSKGKVGRSVSFEDFVDDCERHYRAGTDRLPEHVHQLTLRAGCYAESLTPWLDRFGPRLRVLFAEELQDRPIDVMAGVFDWLDLAPHASLEAGPRNVTMSSRSVLARRLAYGANQWLKPRLVKRPGLERRLRAAYTGLNSGGETPELGEAARARVADFYAEPNRQLERLLSSLGRPTPSGWLVGD